ncbi:aldehyde dehydrogenase family protein [Clavibacter michiganensis]|uniref:aldehyde dehydrogenase family protein n=1 Tax=Clavibacter michiganensis TaxID=28447 RepID=UPI000A37ACD0|nr:aldehyde dehydrogenase family protein [Clavibacter michiganensis]MDO4026624.1 aldehyde dehydrogenase family protein [Clavibacter michiganensis]MDO4029150.1 aldehyde dehydrogenase family protein [Clavibacter michiganensis]MDO4035958.1 aldehyde dehydrogenase family protein [Clavibacter michiganensis]MDO4047562.1 aldehyde dehydrogenase family protein [Clavibacter michiganensis]MDO4075879.1 aldehyde dehydrogenase family protein [Clavibacter michiganensis]
MTAPDPTSRTPLLDAVDPTAHPARRARDLIAHAFSDGIGTWADGRVHPGSGPAIDLVDAATGELVTSYADPGAEGAETALAAATRGARTWGAMDPYDRAAILRDVARAIGEHQEELAVLETVTTGKPIRDARVEAGRVAQMFGYYAGWADKVTGQTIPVPGDWLTYTTRVPWGVVVAVTPWNSPLFTAGWNSSAPLAAGNAVILKPSEYTPLSTIRLAQLAEEAGLPAGVLSVAVGAGTTVGAALSTDRRVGKLSFIGSVPVGRTVAQAAAGAGIPVVLELGGKSANIVFADADLDQAARGAVSAVFSGAGQSCVAGSRLLVERGVHDELVARIVAQVDALRLGDPLDPDTEIGPIISRRQVATIRSLIQAGQEDGATRLSGATPAASVADGALADGSWIMPTILDGVEPGHRLETTEVFGPVLGVSVFDTEEEVVARANATGFGLAGAVWTSDVSRAHRVAAAVDAGTFWINAYKSIHVAVPFGGFGESGHGRSSGPGVLDEYTQQKAVWVPTTAPAAPFPSMRG